MYLNIKKHNVIINIAKLMLGNDMKISLMKRRSLIHFLNNGKNIMQKMHFFKKFIDLWLKT